MKGLPAIDQAGRALQHVPKPWRWALWCLAAIVALALTWQMVFGSLWVGNWSLSQLTNCSEQPEVFWAYLPKSHRSFLPPAWAGWLSAPAAAEWTWHQRGARDLLTQPGEYALTPSALWLHPPAASDWQDSTLHLPWAVPGVGFLLAWLVLGAATLWLFPASLRLCRASPPPRVWQVFLFLGGALVFSLWRKPEWLLSPQLVNEDVAIFAYQAWREGLQAVMLPYAGYYHLLPRLGAALAALWPPEVWPFMYAGVAWLFTAGLGLLVLFSRLLSDWRARLLLAWAVYGVPTGGEVYFQLYNIQWVALGVLLLLLLQPVAANPGQRWTEAGAVLLLGLTTPASILMMPVILARPLVAALQSTGKKWPPLARWSGTFRPGNCQEWLPLCLAGAGAAGWQLLTVLTDEHLSGRGAAMLEPFWLLLHNLLFTTLPAYLPFEKLGLAPALAWALRGLWLIAAFLLWLRMPRLLQTYSVVFLVIAGAILALGFLRPAGGEAAQITNFSPLGEGSRYYFFLGLALLWTVTLMTFGQKNPWWKAGAVLLLAALMVSQATQFRVRPNADYDWASQAPKLATLMAQGAPGEFIELRFPNQLRWHWHVPANP